MATDHDDVLFVLERHFVRNASLQIRICVDVGGQYKAILIGVILGQKWLFRTESSRVLLLM